MFLTLFEGLGFYLPCIINNLIYNVVNKLWLPLLTRLLFLVAVVAFAAAAVAAPSGPYSPPRGWSLAADASLAAWLLTINTKCEKSISSSLTSRIRGSPLAGSLRSDASQPSE